MNIHIKGYDINGRRVDFECSLVEGTITEDGRCRFIDPPLRHMKDCELGDNWKECPACVDGFNQTCKPSEVMEVPLW